MTYSQLAEELFTLKTQEYRKSSKAKDELASTGEDGLLYRLYTGDPNGVLAGELAGSMGLTSGRIANILKRLVEKGYVERIQGRRDRRQVTVVLTEEGKEHIRESYQENIRILEEQLHVLSEEDAQEYIRLYGLLVNAGESEEDE